MECKLNKLDTLDCVHITNIDRNNYIIFMVKMKYIFSVRFLQIELQHLHTHFVLYVPTVYHLPSLCSYNSVRVNVTVCVHSAKF